MIDFDALTFAQKVSLAKRFAKGKGIHGRAGGWIYNSQGGVISQGWFDFFNKRRKGIIEWACANNVIVR